MDTEDARKARVVSQAGESSSRASLQLELRVPDTQMLTIFRDAFLRWMTHRTGPFGRAIGFGDRLSVDEVAPTSDAHGMSTLRRHRSFRKRVRPFFTASVTAVLRARRSRRNRDG